MQSTGVRWLDVLRLRWRSLMRRADAETELESELQFHLDAAAERYMAGGLSRTEAERKARLQFGGAEQIKEECRDQRRAVFWENLYRDAAYALRTLAKSPGFALTAAGTLALGIGVNTALFSMMYSVLLRPLPVAQPESLYNVYVATFGQGNRSSIGTQFFVSYAEFAYMRGASKTADLAAAAAVEMTRQGDPRPVQAQLVSENLLPMIGVRPILGRLFLPEECSKPGSSPVTVLTYSAWQNWFGGAVDIVGRTVLLNRQPFTIVGVAQEGAYGPLPIGADLWVPHTMQPVTRPDQPFINDPNTAWIQVFARTKPGSTVEAVRAEMAVLAQGALNAHSSKRSARASVQRGAFLNYPNIRSQAMPVFSVLLLAVTLVLVVACANVANLLLARGLARRREMAIRLSIGAGRARILQQLLTESVLLASAGGVAGVFVAYSICSALLTFIPTDAGRVQLTVAPDTATVLYTLALTLLTGILFGLAPALNTLRFDLTPALKSTGLDSTDHRRHRLQNVLIGVQAAVCLVLLINAGLLLRSFRHALTMEDGITNRNVAIAEFDLRQQRYSDDQARRFINTLRDTVALAPGVDAASFAMVDPLRDQCGTGVRIVGADGTKRPEVLAGCDDVGPDYFRAMQIPILHGRAFTRADIEGKHNVVVVDDAFAKAHFGNRNPLGQRFVAAMDEVEIIGVARTLRSLDPGTRFPTKVYRPMRALRSAKLLVSYAGPYSDVDRAIRAQAAALDANVTVRTHSIEENIEAVLLPVRLATTGAWAMGGFALLLAVAGIYGVVSFAVSRKRREVGIRVALGAGRRNILRVVVWQGLKPAVIGAVAGVGCAALAAQLLEAMLYGISPFDPVAFMSMPLLVSSVAALAAILPARAALRVDPAVTLRYD